MDKETEQWYENQFELFATQGWKDFVEKVSEIKKAAILEMETTEDNSLFKKAVGVRSICTWLENWESLCRNTKEGLITDDEKII